MKKYIQVLQILVLCLIVSVESFSYKNTTKGTDFWFAFTSSGLSGRLQLTSDVATSGTISCPLQGWSYNFKVSADSIVSLGTDALYYLQKDMRNIVTNNAYHIVTKDPVSLFSSDDSNIGDHTIILPLDGIGWSYVISTYDNGSNPGEGINDCVFYIVATDSNTNIELQTRIKYKGAPTLVNTPVYFTMHKGQTYYVAEDGDLTGSTVRSLDSNKKIAVFSGNHLAKIDSNCSDATEFLHPIWEQQFPVEMMGKQYVTLPYKYRTNGSLIRIVGLENNTYVSLTDSTKIFINAYQIYDTIAYEPVAIKGDKPISVTLFSRNKSCTKPKVLSDSLGEPTMLQMIPVDNMFTGSVVFKTLLLGANNSKKYGTTVMTKTQNVNRIYFDGKSIGSLFQPVKKLQGYSFANIDMDFNIHKLESDVFYYANHYAFCANGTTYEWDGGYSFSLGAGKDFISFTSNPSDTYCEGLPVEFDGVGPKEAKFWYWDFGNGDVAKGKVVTYAFPDTGTFRVTVRVKTDSASKDYWDVWQKEITVIPFIKPVITPQRKTKCPDESITLSVNDNYRIYKWSTGEMMPTIKIKKPGTYSVMVTDTNGCTDFTEIMITEFTVIKPEISVVGESAFCEGDSTEIVVTSDFAHYKWNNGDTTKKIRVKDPDLYRVWVTDGNGCVTVSDPVEIIVNQKPKATITGPNSVCKDNIAKYFLNLATAADVKWTVTGGNILTNDDSLNITVKWGGYGKGKILVRMENTSVGCVGWDSLLITVDSTLKPVLKQSSRFLCKGESVTITADSGYATYEWNTKDTTNKIVVTQPGKYYLNVTGSAGCKGVSDTIRIVEVEKPVVKILGPIVICKGDTVILSSDKSFAKYNWSSGDSTRSIKVSQPGTYKLNIEDINDCTANDEITLKQSEIKFSQFGIINFGKSKINKIKTKKFTISNLASDPVHVDSVHIKGMEGTAFTVSTVPPAPFTLTNNQSAELTINLFPASEKNYSDSVLLATSEPCYKRTGFPVTGLGSLLAIETILSAPDTTTEIGTEKFRIPVHFKLTTKDTSISNLGYKAKISINKNFFFPELITKGKLINNSVVNDKRILEIEDTLITVTGYDSLMTEIEGLVLLGEKTPSPITVEDFIWSDEDIIITPKNGSLTVKGVCQQTISQIKLSDIPSMTITNENNYEKIIFNIEYMNKSVDISGIYDIFVYSSSGILVYRNEINNTGINSSDKIEFRADGIGISSGAYFVILKAPAFTATYPFLIIK